MRLLLDTHAFLWFAWGDPQLSSDARSLIEDPANQKLLSVASIWEIAIKVNVGKLTLAKPLDHFLIEHVDGNALEVLSIEKGDERGTSWTGSPGIKDTISLPHARPGFGSCRSRSATA